MKDCRLEKSVYLQLLKNLKAMANVTEDATHTDAQYSRIHFPDTG